MLRMMRQDDQIISQSHHAVISPVLKALRTIANPHNSQ
jgi:hypothetical protein